MVGRNAAAQHNDVSMNLDSETLTLFRRDGSRLLILVRTIRSHHMQVCSSVRLTAAVIFRPRVQARRTVIRMAADVPTKTYKLDASSEGCTGANRVGRESCLRSVF